MIEEAPTEQVPAEVIPPMMPDGPSVPQSMPAPSRASINSAFEVPGASRVPQLRQMNTKNENPFRAQAQASDTQLMSAPHQAAVPPATPALPPVPSELMRTENPFRTATLTDEAVLR